MTLVFTDSFDSYTSTADLAKKWSLVGSWTWSATGGISGGGCVTTSAISSLQSPIGIGLGSNLLGFACYFKIAGTPNAGSSFITINGGHTLALTSTGVWALLDGIGIQRNTLGTNWCDNRWHWLEYRAQCNGGGQVYVQTDNLVEFNGSMFYSGGVTFDRFQLGGVSGTTCFIDDLFVYDGNSTFPDADTATPIGYRRINLLKPASDNSIQFSRVGGSGTNASAVNETVMDGDTSYVEDGTSGHQDLYEFDDLPYPTVTPAPTITAVMANAQVRNGGTAGTITTKQICKSSAVQSDGLAVNCPPSYAIKFQQFATDPNTSAAWTETNLNAAKFGVKVT